MHGVVLHAHPVRGESHNKRNTTGEVATVPTLVSFPIDLSRYSFTSHCMKQFCESVYFFVFFIAHVGLAVYYINL